jgi:hypothetical protein
MSSRIICPMSSAAAIVGPLAALIVAIFLLPHIRP